MFERIHVKNTYTTYAIVAVVVAIVAFYGGVQDQLRQSKPSGSGSFMGREMGAGMNRDGAQKFGQDRAGAPMGMRPVSGEIISQDDTSLTIKLDDGSSKIVILADSTNISKNTTAAKNDLKVGEKITVFGTTNTDGSMTAENVSLGEMMFRRLNKTNDQTQPTNQAEQKK